MMKKASEVLVDYPESRYQGMDRTGNTVFFKCPSDDIATTYFLAKGYDVNFGGDLAYIVVIQQIQTNGQVYIQNDDTKYIYYENKIRE